MEIKFRVTSASKCPHADVLAALDIYCKTVDPGSYTDTNQIKDYIWNQKAHQTEERLMFFYLLYGTDDTVEGFAELAYLPNNQVLVLDYLCTSKRSSVQFYNFYHLVLEEIETVLKQRHNFIRYVITELSLNYSNGKLIDTDSNYFRHLLSNENYQLLKFPYYQPPILKNEPVQEFNLAIKLLSIDSDRSLILTKATYFSIVQELYYSHYLAWYRNYQIEEQITETIDALLKRIRSEIPNDLQHESISMIQCQLFEEGQCPKFTAENYTIPRSKKKKQKKILSIAFWIFLTVLTFIFCIIPSLSKYATVSCSLLTIVAGVISIFSFRKEFLGQK